MSFVNRLFRNEYSFPAFFLQYAFAIYFILVGVKKFRGDGAISGFANSLTEGAMGTERLAADIPAAVLMVYGYVLPIAELLAGVFLLVNKNVRLAYVIIGLIYLTFVFGQMYSGNTGKIGTDYLPSLVALSVAVFMRERDK